MPPTETKPGDSRRDPIVLILVAALLLVLRVGVTAWERQNAPPPDSSFPNVRINPGP
jgi:hypothetical protein